MRLLCWVFWVLLTSTWSQVDLLLALRQIWVQVRLQACHFRLLEIPCSFCLKWCFLIIIRENSPWPCKVPSRQAVHRCSCPQHIETWTCDIRVFVPFLHMHPEIFLPANLIEICLLSLAAPDYKWYKHMWNNSKLSGHTWLLLSFYRQRVCGDCPAAQCYWRGDSAFQGKSVIWGKPPEPLGQPGQVTADGRDTFAHVPSEERLLISPEPPMWSCRRNQKLKGTFSDCRRPSACHLCP